MRRALHELRLAVRQLVRSPGFTIAVVLTLAIGIGATTAVFSLVNAILLEPLSYANAERLVAVSHTAPGLKLEQAGMSDGAYLHYRDHSRSFEALGTYYENVVNLSGDGEPERVPIAMVSHTFFSVLGARTALGRLPSVEDVDGSGEVVVLISHALWQQRYGGRRDIIGNTIEANGAPRRVIGVLERGFDFPRREIGIWYPTGEPNPATARAADFSELAIARLRPGVDAASAEAELNRLIPSLPNAYPDMTAALLDEAQFRVVVTPLKDVIVGGARTALWLLLGGMAFLLAIACANVANLLLLRAEHRQKEITVRTALGASRRDLAWYFAAESLSLAMLGGALGLVFADWAVQALVAFGPTNLPRLHQVAVDVPVIAFAASVAFVIGLFFAPIPLLRARRSTSGSVLTQHAFGATAGTERQRIRRVLVTAQVALALTLVAGSALMLQSFWKLYRADPGFDRDDVLTAEVALPFRGYQTYEQSQRLWSALLERTRALPGVEHAGLVGGVPLVPRPAYNDFALDVEGRPGEARSATTIQHVTDGYFEALRIPVIEGRALDDAIDVQRPVLLSAAAARKLFPGESAIGKRLRRAITGVGHVHESEPNPWATVIGVVGDVPKEHIGGDPAEILYLPVLDYAVDPGLWPSHVTLVVRSTLAPGTIAPAIRQILRELDPHLPLANVRMMARIVADSMARMSFTMVLLMIAAAAALILGALGLYGVIAYTVARRTHEFGIRLALGARAADVRRIVLGESVRLALRGIGFGVLAVLALTRMLRGLLYEVSPTDPLTVAAVSVLVFGVALLAGWIPARRSTRIEPMRALKTD